MPGAYKALQELWIQKVEGLDRMIILAQEQYQSLIEQKNVEEITVKIEELQFKVNDIDEKIKKYSNTELKQLKNDDLANVIEEARARMNRLVELNQQSSLWIVAKVSQVGHELQGLRQVRKVKSGYMSNPDVSPRFMDEKG
jgi:superfamily II RNA helicase